MAIDIFSVLSPHARDVVTKAHRSFKLAALVTATLTGLGTPLHAENPDITSRRAAERTDFTNEEIRDGFFKIAFGAELQIGAPADRVRKFDEPVRIFVEGGGPDRRREIARVVADIGSRVNHLDIGITNDRRVANFTVRLVPQRKFTSTIRALYGNDR